MCAEDPEFEPRATAFHEAGHVLLCEVFEFPYTDVQLEGEVNYSPSQEPDPESSCLEKMKYACICLSGGMAEDLFRYPPDWMDVHGYALAFGGGIVDRQKYAELKLPQNYYLSLRDLSKEIVSEGWEVVSQIAEQLLESEKLTSDDVRQMLDQSWVSEVRQKYTERLRVLSSSVPSGGE